MECYICTETTDEKSPCTCKATVHDECLKKFVEESGNTNCTICKAPLEGIELKQEEVKETRCLQFLKFLTFMICGYLGRAFFTLIFQRYDLTDKYFWIPLEMDFFILAFCIYFSMMTFLKSFTYIRCCAYNQYDTFDSDSELDDVGENV